MSSPDGAFTLAAAQFPVRRYCNWTEYERLLESWFEGAAAQQARLLIFPEYAAMSLASLLGDESETGLAGQLTGLQNLRDDYLRLHRRLAGRHGCHVVAGSMPWKIDDGSFRNRAWVCAPDGGCDYQDKQIMTRFEREIWGISGGGALKLFDSALGRFAVNLCYDAEFPLLARAQIEAGAALIAVPSCTDTLAGYHRVRVASRARALEGQCYVVQAPLVGEAPWSLAVDLNIGAAGVFGPPDLGFPETGVVATGVLNEVQWLFADVDLANVAIARQSGQVFNYRHWAEQPAVAAVERIRL